MRCLLLLPLVLWSIVGRIVRASEDEFRLLRDLKEDYDPIERPVQNHSDAVDVQLRVILQQILDVDEKNQVLTLVIWMQFTWVDYKMVWDPAEYGGIQMIQVPSDSLWRPDVLLFNSADEHFDARFDVNLVARSNGSILQTPPAIVRSSCSIDITWFPFDEQICFLKYGSWTYTGSQLNLTIDDPNEGRGPHMMDISYYVPNGEWELVATPAKRIASGYQDDLFIELYFYLHIRRKVVYYGINWIIPSILFLFSNVLGFSLPAECGEKITLQTTNLLSVTVFLGMVADVTPPTSTSVPVIAAFFSISMILLGSSVIFTLLVINVHFRSPKTHKMSPWVRTIFLEWMPWLLLMQRPGKQFSNPKKKDQPSDDVIVHKPLSVRGRSDSSASRLARCENGGSPKIGKLRRRGVVRQAEDGEPLLAESDQPTNAQERQTSGTEIPLADENKHCRCASCSANLTTLSTVRKTMTELSEYLQASKQRMEEDDEEEEAQADWRFMAMTIDRACLFVYAIVTFMLPIYIFLATPVPAMPKDGNYTTIL